MRKYLYAITSVYAGLFLAGCSESGPGYLFQLIFIVAPILGLGFLLLKRTESTNDSLYVLEGQLKRLSAKIDNLEEKVAEITGKESKTRTKK